MQFVSEMIRRFSGRVLPRDTFLTLGSSTHRIAKVTDKGIYLRIGGRMQEECITVESNPSMRLMVVKISSAKKLVKKPRIYFECRYS
jgi:hypothetical protein